MSDHKFILEQIWSGAYSLSPQRKGKSFIWNILSKILKEDGSTVEGFVYCRSCRKVLKYCRNQTSNLNRHKCCQTLKQPNLRPVSTPDKKETLNVLSKWVIEDCRPFSSVSGSRFKEIVKHFIKIGATYGECVDVDDMLPDATTISRKCQKEAEECKANISKELKEVVCSGGVSITTDLWTDNYVKRTFLGATLHYQKEYQTVDIILGIKSMDFQRSTSTNVLQKLTSLLKEFDIDNMERIKFVTDRGTNIVKALENNIRLNCSCHLFANVLKKSFDETIDLADLITACKKIVKYFKKANMQHKLNTSLKNPCDTRWNSNYTMCKSVLDNWIEVNNILKEANEHQRLQHIDLNTLTVLVDLCKNFDIVFKELQTCSSASLCFVLPSIYKVKTLCQPNSTDISSISLLKTNIYRNVKEIWENNLSIWHKVAFFLYPPAVNLQLGLNEIKEFCISEIEKLPNNTAAPTSLLSNSDSPATSSSTLSNIDSPVQKNIFFFSNLLQRSTDDEQSAFNELEKYCNENVFITEDFEVMRWWQNTEKSYPLLSKFALQVHSIPASSAAAERAFSLAGNIITEKRNRLAPKAVDSIVFLHSLYKNKHTYN